MERYNSHGIDEMGQLVLHGDLRKKLGFETAGEVSMMPVEHIVILRRLEGEPESGCFTSSVCNLGRINLPADLREKMGWQVKNRVAIYNTGNLIILKLAEAN